MHGVRLGGALLATSASLLAAHAVQAGNCKLNRLPDIPVTMRGLKPTVHAQINGVDALFIADSGAFFNLVTPAAAKEFHLRIDAGRNLYLEGTGGAQRAQFAWAKSFTIMGHPVANVPFVVADGYFGAGTIGLLGQNFWRLADVEYDLANGVIRLVRPQDCNGVPLAYWARATGQPYSVIDIESATERDPHTKAFAYLNGTRIRVLFDTGAAVSMLTLDAAKRAGISPNSPEVEAGGPVMGIGRKVPNTWIARFASFKIGDEEIDNARLRFGDLNLLQDDLLIGADFFLSHRIYVATSQSKLYFTYNGGPVFDLTAQNAAETPAPATGSAPSTGPTGTTTPAPAAATDAAPSSR